jgi:hypothetical protein
VRVLLVLVSYPFAVRAVEWLRARTGVGQALERVGKLETRTCDSVPWG